MLTHKLSTLTHMHSHNVCDSQEGNDIIIRFLNGSRHKEKPIPSTHSSDVIYEIKFWPYIRFFRSSIKYIIHPKNPHHSNFLPCAKHSKHTAKKLKKKTHKKLVCVSMWWIHCSLCLFLYQVYLSICFCMVCLLNS